jgi:uncharacterized protein GlcG (DUF336 family)
MSIHPKVNVKNLIGRARTERIADAAVAKCDWCGYPVTHAVHRRTGCEAQRQRVEAQYGIEPESHRRAALSGSAGIVDAYHVNRQIWPDASGMKGTRI